MEAPSFLASCSWLQPMATPPTCRALGLTRITPGSRVGSEHYFPPRIHALNMILAGGSRIPGSDLICNTPALSAVIRTLRVSYSMQLLNYLWSVNTS